MDKPLVSIWMLTYNHENYIAQAIESVISQKTDFPILLILGEDCSTDNTRDICIDYKNKYPDKIELHLNEKNDIVKNAKKIYNACFASEAKYIAMLEADDYWTDPYKLQKQVNYLEKNQEYVLCFHNTLVVENNTNKKYQLIQNNSKQKYTTNDLLKQWHIHSNSIVFRNVFNELPDWFYTVASGDIILLLLLSTKGPFHYIDEIMSVYRKHANGISKTNAHLGYQKVMNMCYLYQHFNVYTKYKYQEKILEAIKSEVNTHVLKKEKQKYKQEFEKLFSQQWENNLINNVDYLEDKISLGNALKLVSKKILKKLR